jgi:PTH1 family peptidyl-tRNA hydrolase
VHASTVVLGLGNPGERYRRTRHNLGFRVVDRLAERSGARFTVDVDRRATAAEPTAGDVVLAKPRTYMNLSGRAAVALCGRYRVTAERLLVVYDDADLVLGRIRIRPRGGPGGHNGLRSLIDALRTDGFPRVRLGVLGRERESTELEQYVLEPFAPDEEPVVEGMVTRAAEAVELILEAGIEAAMNRCNTRTAGEPPGPSPCPGLAGPGARW